MSDWAAGIAEDVTHTCCHYCGLPLPGRPLSGEAAPSPRYCCFGCRFAEAVTQERGEAGHVRGTLTRLGVAIFLSMNVMVMTLALWSQDVYNDAEAGRFAGTFHELLRYGSLMFTAPVLLLLGGPLLESVLSNWRSRSAATDMLLLTGVAASFVYSLASTVRGTGHVYYEVTCMVLVAVTLGRWLEATGKLKTTEALRALESLLPDQVRVVQPGGMERETPLKQVRPGDVLRVLAGERIPVDGRVVRNSAHVDQQAVTGESEPVVKQPGDEVFSGTLNLDGDLRVEACEAGGAGTLRQMIDAVATAAMKNERYQRLADRISSGFLPAVIVVATVTFAGHAAWHDLPAGMLAALAVVLIACPCALGLATPMALWVALGGASRSQVLFRDGDSLTRLASLRVVCFDKTGTLTTGQPTVEQLVLDDTTSRSDLLRVASSLAAGSNHVLAQAVAAFAEAALRGDASSAGNAAQGDRCSADIDDLQTHPGRGVSARSGWLHETVLMGSERFLRDEEQWDEQTAGPWSRTIERSEGSLVFLAWGGRPRGAFLFREQLRPGVRETLDWCRSRGLHVEVLTGDHPQRARRLQEQLGVPVRAALLPGEKQSAVERLRTQFGPVLMVGDGINDAPALGAADVGAAMGCAADVSRYSADVCLLGNDLSRIPRMIQLGQRTVGVIRWNLVWAFSYNSMGILLAAAGLLNPIVAAGAMVVSSLMVVSNALRLDQP